MTRYSVQPRDRIFFKCYEFLSFAKNMGKIIGKNINKNLRGKYGQKPLDHAKKFVTDAIKTSAERVIQKTAEAPGDLIGNKIASRITKVSKKSQRNNSETVTNRHDNEISKKRYIYIYIYIYPEKRHEIIHELRLK